MKVSVDFDGTITQSSRPFSEGFNKIRPYCKTVMEALSRLGVEFVLLTGREDEWVSEAVELCEEWDLPINTAQPTRKVISDYYIDDKSYGMTRDIDWRDIGMELFHYFLVRQEEAQYEEGTFI